MNTDCLVRVKWIPNLLESPAVIAMVRPFDGYSQRQSSETVAWIRAIALPVQQPAAS
jgi:hypothetical protein